MRGTGLIKNVVGRVKISLVAFRERRLTTRFCSAFLGAFVIVQKNKSPQNRGGSISIERASDFARVFSNTRWTGLIGVELCSGRVLFEDTVGYVSTYYLLP